MPPRTFPNKVAPYRFFNTDPSDQQKVVVSEVVGTQYPSAFSATDIFALLNLPWGEVRPFGTLAAVSISSHRDTFPVTSMPYVSPRGFTQGHRTVAGTLMFNTIDRGAFTPTLTSIHKHPDELPLFDILFTYVNEAGMLSYEQLLGVRLLDFGKTVALENLQPIESYSYMALDYTTLKSLINKDDVTRRFFLQKNTNRSQQPVTQPGLSGTSTVFDPRIPDNTGGDPFPSSDPTSNFNVGLNTGSSNPKATNFGR